MARIDSTRLILQALDTADRVNFVREDPAVVKAFKTAKDDGVQFLRSSSDAWHEGRLSWRRSAVSRRSASTA